MFIISVLDIVVLTVLVGFSCASSDVMSGGALLFWEGGENVSQRFAQFPYEF